MNWWLYEWSSLAQQEMKASINPLGKLDGLWT